MPFSMSSGSVDASITTAGSSFGLRPSKRSNATIPPANIAPTVP
jgi:hypothetical protein